MPHDQQKTIVVSGVFPSHLLPGAPLVETVRDPRDPTRLLFLRWENGIATVAPRIEHNGVVYVPPDPRARLHPEITLPDGVRPCRQPAALIADMVDLFGKFVETDREQLLLLASLGLCSWFPDCFETVPYCWIVGPPGSAKTKLLRLLSCVCRRALLVGDIRPGSLYTLTDSYNPTLLIDELDLDDSSRSADILRLLRTGTAAGVPAVRNGTPFSTYGVKAVASRQVPRDAALLSRGFIIRMLPTRKETAPLDDHAMCKISQRLQPELLEFRFTSYSKVKKFRLAPRALQDCTPRTRQIGLALAAPLQGHLENESLILSALRERDSEAEAERLLEPEWLVGEALFRQCHEGEISSTLVGGIAASINQKLEFQGEDFRIGARRVGWILKSLGVPTQRLGSLGRGLMFMPGQRRQIHAIARHLGICRRTIATLQGLEAGYGGSRCLLCEEFGLTDGLRFGEPGNGTPRRFSQDQRCTVPFPRSKQGGSRLARNVSGANPRFPERETK